ncbi:uncharacterized protein TNCV_1055771 [Trichonephila clavipes]|nr:uncharacterized protein TNCV_1055771 [Trichonephila clavipes]
MAAPVSCFRIRETWVPPVIVSTEPPKDHGPALYVSIVIIKRYGLNSNTSSVIAEIPTQDIDQTIRLLLIQRGPKVVQHINTIFSEKSTASRTVQSDMDFTTSKTVLEAKQEEFVNDALIYAKVLCEELEVSFELPRLIRRKHIFGDGSKDAQFLYEDDLRRTNVFLEDFGKDKKLIKMNKNY